jgi:hypothetical protein
VREKGGEMRGQGGNEQWAKRRDISDELGHQELDGQPPQLTFSF